MPGPFLLPSKSVHRHNRFVTTIDTVRDLAAAVHAAGGRALIVGGWVRDRLLGQADLKVGTTEVTEELDMEVFGIPAQDLPAKNPLEGDPDAIRGGMGLFRARCADCHGMDARGVRGPIRDRWRLVFENTSTCDDSGTANAFSTERR